jgi:hypothetical protein
VVRETAIFFKDDVQRARACRGLLAPAGLQYLFTINGPNQEAKALLEKNGDPLERTERVLFLAAWDLWCGWGKLHFNDILTRIDLRDTERIASLVVAAKRNTAAVDAWLTHYGIDDPSSRRW